MELMFGEAAGEDQDVIKVDKHKVVQEVPQDVIDEDLEDCGGVSEAERHDQVYKVDELGIECSLPLVSFSDPNQVYGAPQVQFTEDRGSLQGRQ